MDLGNRLIQIIAELSFSRFR